jgi:8-oxo-dGTP pyrophosphatase MutT (NUDIX family)
VIAYEYLDEVTVCICAPMRSSGQIAELERRLGLAGAIVLAPVPPGEQLTPDEYARLKVLHLRKIAAADAVVVANTDGYTGPGTAEEIAYAMRLAKELSFLEDPIRLRVDPEVYAGLVGRTRFIELRPAQQFPAKLARGSVVRITAADDERGALFRAAEVLRYPGLTEAAASIDPTRMGPGLSGADLAEQLRGAHPGTDDDAYLAVELDFLGEEHSESVAAPARLGVRVGLLACGPDGTVVLERGQPGALDLPSVQLGPGEDPATAARRLAWEVFEQSADHVRLAAVDLGAGGVCAGYVFDAGPLDPGHLARLFRTEKPGHGRLVFAACDRIHAMVAPRTARVIAAVLERLEDGGTIVLEDGFAPGARLVWQWHASEQPPNGVPVTQAGVWAFDRDGRVVLQHRIERGGAFALPAGSPEPGDRDWLATAAREAFEESQILIDHRAARLIGFQVTYGDRGHPNGLAQARYVAPVLGYRPIAADSDPKLTRLRAPYRRYLTDIRRAAGLLDWGPHAEAQTRAAEQAAREMGVPVDRPAADGYRDHGDAPAADRVEGWDVAL